METEPYSKSIEHFFQVDFLPFTTDILTGFIVLVILLVASAFISGAEVAFFSLKPEAISNLRNSKKKVAQTAYKLIQTPHKLLSSILVLNNFVNVAIVILSSFLSISLVNFVHSPIFGIVFQVVVIATVLMTFAEILPKVIAVRYSLGLSKFMAYPIFFGGKLFAPLCYFLTTSTDIVDRRTKKHRDISMNDLSDALDLTEKGLNEEKEMLKGIVEFTNTDVSEIMKPRVDVVAVNFNADFQTVLPLIVDSGFSRIPVYQDTFDEVKGVLYIKDLLPYIQTGNDFEWQKLIREAFFVPENKKVNDLLAELQEKKIHMAIVVDEYGGTSGIVTLEDILEEIVGDIADEFDEQRRDFVKVNPTTYLFEGKVSLNDFCKVINYQGELFDDSNADTLAGFILEQSEEIPAVYEKFDYEKFTLQIEAVDNRRIKKVKVILHYEESMD